MDIKQISENAIDIINFLKDRQKDKNIYRLYDGRSNSVLDRNVRHSILEVALKLNQHEDID